MSTQAKPKATREAFGEAMVRLGEKYPQIVLLDADLSESTRSALFAKRFPERFIQCGIAEANMIGIAAGLALTGKVPFCCSFAAFLTGRFDQIKMSVGYSAAPVRLVGSHVGVGIGEDGYSQQGLEDIALTRIVPTMAVLQPADDVETDAICEHLVHHAGPAFLRTTRQKVERVNPDGYKFQFGKGTVLADGKDVTIVASGGTVWNSLRAAELLAADRISVRVINLHTIKPIDRDLLLQAARETRRIVTVEDHQVAGGLGGAVCEALCEVEGVRIHRHGIHDEFGQSGTPEALYKHYKLDSAGIAEVVKSFLG